MVVIKRNTMSLIERSSVGAGSFWGLVQQKGPWKTTKFDVQNAKTSKGYGDGTSFMRPADRDAWKAPPLPSKYATRSIMMSSGYMKKPFVGGMSVMSPTAMSLGMMKPDDVGKAGMAGYIPPLGGYPAYETGENAEDYYEDVEMEGPSPTSFGMTEHRMEEAAQGATTVEVKEEQEMGQPEAMKMKPSGAARRPIPKVRMHPYARGAKKEVKQPRDFVGDIGNIIKTVFGIASTVVPTYKPPVYDQVAETAKASTKRKSESMAGGVKKELKPPGSPGSPLIGKKHPLRFKEGPAVSKFPKKMMSGPATEMVTKGEKRKAESQTSARAKKGKLTPSPGVAPQGTKRKAESDFAERMKKGRLSGPRDAAMKAKFKMAETAKPKKKSKK
jgi:hypothetical protein